MSVSPPGPWARGWRKIELMLVGPLPAGTRHAMYVDFRAACVHSVIATIIPFLPVILRRLGASSDQVALYYAISYAGLVTTGAGIWLMRRWGMRTVARLSWLIGRGAFLLAALVSGPRELLLVAAIFWIFEAWPSPAYLQTMQLLYPEKQRGRMMALVRTGLGVLMLIFTPIAGWILDHLGYRVLLPMAALSGIGSTLIFSPMIPAEAPAQSTQQSAAPWDIVRGDPRFAAYLAGMLLFGLGGLMASPLYPLIQVDKLNLSYTVIGWLGLAQSLAWLIGYLFGGRLVDRLGGARSLQIAFIINAVVILPYIWAGSGLGLLPAFIAAGLVSAGVDLFGIYAVIQLADPQRVPEYTTTNSVVLGLRGVVAPFIGPALLRAGLPISAIFGLGAALTLIAAVAIIPSLRPASS